MLLFHSAMDLGRLRWAISRKEPMLIRLILHTNSQGRLDRSLSGEGRPQHLLLSGDHEHRRSHRIWLCWEEGLAESERSLWSPNIICIFLCSLYPASSLHCVANECTSFRHSSSSSTSLLAIPQEQVKFSRIRMFVTINSISSTGQKADFRPSNFYPYPSIKDNT